MFLSSGRVEARLLRNKCFVDAEFEPLRFELFQRRTLAILSSVELLEVVGKMYGDGRMNAMGYSMVTVTSIQHNKVKSFLFLHIAARPHRILVKSSYFENTLATLRPKLVYHCHSTDTDT